jgi:hypothetical protein
MVGTRAALRSARVAHPTVPAYLRSTNIARHSPEPVFSAACEAVTGTAFAPPVFGVTVVVLPSAAVSFNVQSLTE